MVNYKAAQTGIETFHGKLVILDFWSVWCAPCIKAFPKMEALQQQFGTGVQIIGIACSNPVKEVKAFIEKRKGTTRAINLPVSIQDPLKDTLLQTLFPSGGFPHEVWIDKNGMVIAITGGDYVTAANIKKALDGKILDLPVKNYQAGFDREKPLLVNNNGGSGDAFIYRSLITPRIDSIAGFGFERYKDSSHTRLFIANETVFDMLKYVYGMLDTGLSFLPRDRLNKRIIATAEKIQAYSWPVEGCNDPETLNGWLENHEFCYELILPPDFTLRQAYKKMIADIECYFNFRTTAAYKKITCLSLIVADSTKIKIAGNKPGIIFSDDANHYHFSFNNREVNNITAWINSLFPCLAVAIDETAIATNIDLDITVAAPYDLQALRKALQEGVFDLVLKEQVLKMLVIE